MTDSSTALNRRTFAQQLAAGVGGLSCWPVTTAFVQPAEVEPPSPAMLLLAAVVSECPGEHWNERLLADVLQDIEGDLSRGRQLRTVPLTNAAEPATIFRAPAVPQP